MNIVTRKPLQWLRKKAKTAAGSLGISPRAKQEYKSIVSSVERLLKGV